MEDLFKVSEVGELVTNQWTPENGQPRTIASVELTLTNGVDTMVAEANDDLARLICKQVEEKAFNTMALYRVRLKFAVRKSKTKEIKFNSIRIIDMAKL